MRPASTGLLCIFITLAIACAADEDLGTRDGGAGADGSTPMADGAARPDGGSLDGGEPDAGGDPCGATRCSPGQRCEDVGGEPTCVDNRCDDLDCTETERCEPHPDGGNVCVSIACDEDVECAEDEYCDGTVCVADVCEPGERSCMGDAVRECASNGGGEEPLFTCGSAGYFHSACVEGDGRTGCACEDDWDCPEYTDCEAGRCVGTGTAPSCTLPPVAFSDVLPAVEIEWGGESRTNDDARDGTPDRNPAPWAAYSHALNTPIVANLDDDNGDGLIDERDFPEIVFATHQGDNPWGNAVLRAIHGGGPNKGADYFARCGNELWTRAAPSSATCTGSAPDADAGAPVAVGDLDGDGVPEIVYTTESNTFRILDNTGAEIYTLPGSLSWSATTSGETVSIANLDYEGFPELIVGRTVYVLGEDGGDLTVVYRLQGNESAGLNEISQMTCPADVRSDLAGQELVAGATLYRIPDTLPACGSPPCTESLEVVWNAPDIGGQGSRLTGNGFCAVADVWGADHDSTPGPDNPPDGKPEVVLIDDGDLTILDARTGEIIEDRSLGGGDRGGAPNVDDFDGDGFMEVASALQNFYIVEDLQVPTSACPAWPTVIARNDMAGGAHNPNPDRSHGGSCGDDGDCGAGTVCNETLGQCVCLHNGWKRDSDDDSSKATSSSVFDFNGDGAAEVLYNDECDFRVYDGLDGEVLFSEMSRSRTGIENPVVADVDNDGNAEVVSVSNTATGNRCDEDGSNPKGPNGIRVWGDPSDTWVSARRIWNQQSYHVVNVTENATIPAHPPESWAELNGRVYNTYRSQPRNFGVAPDLTVVGIGISSPEAACGTLSDTVEITFEVRNDGDLRVGPGVVVQILGTWDGTEEPLLDPSGDPLEVTLTSTLEPGRSAFLSVTYERSSSDRGELPDSVRIVVDPTTAGMPDGAARECVEDNNDRVADVDAGDAVADLRIEAGAATATCGATDASATLEVTLTNDGATSVTDVVVRYYAGNPAASGTEIHEEVRAGPIGPGGTDSWTATIPSFPTDRDITIWAVADPDNDIVECNDANNADPAANSLACFTGPI